VLLELVCPMPPNDSVYDALDERVNLVLEADRGGYVIPRIVFVPSTPWRAQYPMEMQSYERGSGDDPSIASDHFWGEAERSLRLLIEHARRTSYGDRVIGYHLERGEWFQPADGGYDRSYANREGFRRWLRRKYGDDEVALRASWFDGEAQFYAADIPPDPDPPANTVFFDPRRERRWIDFMEYTSDITADRIIGLARAVKQATEGRALVSACYGYTCEFAHPWSGHLALARLLECPDLDLLTGPASYSERAPGNSGAAPGPVSAIGLHGKLWVTEDDTKTHLSGAGSKADPYNPRMENRAATEAVHLRSIGSALCNQTGLAWMDLWGEGWLDCDDTWKTLGLFTEATAKIAKTRRRETPDVVALVDERSLCHFSGGQGLMQKVLHGNRESLLRCGASVGLYLQSDVTHKDFPTDARLYIFLTPYRLPDDQREAVRERLRLPGRTLVWLYTVGSMTDRSAPEEPTPDVVGLNLRPQSWNSEVGTRIVDPGHVITQGVPDRQLGSRMRLNPSYYVDDDGPGLTVLGEYQQSGLPSLALRSTQGWTTVFCGEPVLSPELLRGLCRYAGAHLYTRAPEDYAQAGYGWLAMHILRDGQRTITLPAGTALWDVADGCRSQPDANEYRTPVKARTTRLFAIAPPEALRKLGFDMSRVRAVAAPLPPPSLPPPPPLPSAEPERRALTEAATAEPVVAETPDEVASAPVSHEESAAVGGAADAVSAASEQPQEPTDSVSKRRRRRGGRGRGRRRKGAAGQTQEGSASEPGTPSA